MILHLLHSGRSYQQIEKKLDMVSHTITLWKKRYEKSGLAGLKDLQRPGAKRKITAATQARILRIATSPPLPGQSHWSASEISKKTGVSKTMVLEILKMNHLKPHLHAYFMASNDEQFEAKASDIIGLYMNPPRNAVVLCADEKTQIQALNRLQPNLPMKKHLIERRTFEYERNGITNLFAAFNTKSGRVSAMCSETKTQHDFIEFLDRLNAQYRGQSEIHLILDNLKVHDTENVRRWLNAHPRWKFHFTPKYSSWINQVEIWFSLISRKCICRGVFPSVRDLITKIKAFIREYNKSARPFEWTYSDPKKRISYVTV